MGDLLTIFARLDVLGVNPNEKLENVNNFVANEVSIDIGKIKDKDISSDNLLVSLWYLSENGENYIPKIIELSFNCYWKEKDKKYKIRLEEFPMSLIGSTDKFYLGLFEKEEFVDLNSAKTKIEFAYSCHND